MKGNHKKTLTKEERIQQSSKLLEENKDQIPVICEKDPSCTLEALVKTKYLIKRTITINQFKRTLLKKFKVESLEALFLFVTNKTQKVAVIGDVSFGEVYDKYKDDDGFLYLIYTNEKIWG